jgi:hypothetical protein
MPGWYWQCVPFFSFTGITKSEKHSIKYTNDVTMPDIEDVNCVVKVCVDVANDIMHNHEVRDSMLREMLHHNNLQAMDPNRVLQLVANHIIRLVVRRMNE